MIFRFLLFCSHLSFATAIKIACLRSKGFKKRLCERDFSIVVRTRDHAAAKTFLFTRGCLKSKGEKKEPDLLIEWASPKKAIQAINKRSLPDLADSMTSAVAAGELAVEFNAEPMAWFGEVMSEMIPAINGATTKRGSR